uniref:Dynein light chain n=1 Tax=Chenopodium quinoa TaxID=63459 RepID=A0A803LS96_CHEQI
MSEETKPPIDAAKPGAEDRKPPLMGAGKRIIIKNADMADDMQKEAIDIAIAAFEKVNVEKDVAESIKKEFDKKHGPTWHCIVGRNFGGGLGMVYGEGGGFEGGGMGFGRRGWCRLDNGDGGSTSQQWGGFDGLGG